MALFSTLLHVGAWIYDYKQQPLNNILTRSAKSQLGQLNILIAALDALIRLVTHSVSTRYPDHYSAIPWAAERPNSGISIRGHALRYASVHTEKERFKDHMDWRTYKEKPCPEYCYATDGRIRSNPKMT